MWKSMSTFDCQAQSLVRLQPPPGFLKRGLGHRLAGQQQQSPHERVLFDPNVFRWGTLTFDHHGPLAFLITILSCR